MKSRNPQQLKKTLAIGRNDSCPCGSGKKFKKCCCTESFLNRKLNLAWLKKNDPQSDIKYDEVTDDDLRDMEVVKMLWERRREIEFPEEVKAEREAAEKAEGKTPTKTPVSSILASVAAIAAPELLR